MAKLSFCLCLSNPRNFLMNEILSALYADDVSSIASAFPLPQSGGVFFFLFEESM